MPGNGRPVRGWPGRPGAGRCTAGDGLEAAARQSRYDFLRDAAGRLGARYVVTGHTADDQAETILHRILRGTGIAGLAGMARARPLGEAATLVRPMLEIRRAEVLEYLGQIGQPFRHDRTNDDRQFTRNRIRSELLPSLAAQYNPGVVEALLRLGRLAGEAQSVAAPSSRPSCPRAMLGGSQGDLRVLLGALEGQPRYIVRELLMAAWRDRHWPLQAMGFEQWDLLADMAASGSADRHLVQKRTFPGGILAEVRDGELRLASGPVSSEPGA